VPLGKSRALGAQLQQWLVMLAYCDDAMKMGTMMYARAQYWQVKERHDAVGRRIKRETEGAYAPSVLVTMGRLFLLSLGEDILEVWGEVRAV
jgi:hypothetical protein